ncbi:energy-coupling factor ABC transporter ATP-binding protein [Actinosynnema pretiosum subsp. pretiosum]|uniref:Energy-coupling factor ABC transporter ATP-binding protein n=1 Tax=Actinosynnema pretiosum subsp. pretiosum TaxID=103721 RepID=A0AA45R5V9_9PSEU|nr:Duplicated ATPase component CbrU of energizing module of predicted cobalamin ECF transporter [Actinosynnema pretiosum subsp. pretiosum]QUF06090.1 energy-coupling factor ABC transporter ATP-binding protein [Actinosynnema pretiosum subsp. pretiosum]
MIRFEQVSITYPDAPAPVLSDVDLVVPEGELCLVVGRTGSGKSTLLRAANGLVPHFSGGELTGRVLVAGRDTRDHPPRELADVVGLVAQDPWSGFVTDSVEEELAYSMESLALPNPVMRKRVEETLDLLGLADLRDRPLSALSGGQQQRVAIGAALTAHPSALVLDEPTSALDPGAAEDVLAALLRLVHDLGMTVLVAEHRLERVAQYADRVVLVRDGRVSAGPPAEVLAGSAVAPPVVRLGALAGWSPVPVSVRDARRAAGGLRERLAGVAPPEDAPVGGPPVLRAEGVRVGYPGVDAVRGVDLAVRAGERVALMGRNGSGKSSLLWAVQGSGSRAAGKVLVLGADGEADPADLKPGARRELVGLVPQQPADLLYLHDVAAECAQADHESGRGPGTCRALLDGLAPGVPAGAHPRDLSEGQRLALVLAIALTAAPRAVLLDEPTRGLDVTAKRRLVEVLRGLSGRGAAVVLATHDVEFAAECATRVVVLAGGEVVADGPTPEVVTSSPVFAPQVSKVLAPGRWLTVEQVEGALR